MLLACATTDTVSASDLSDVNENTMQYRTRVVMFDLFPGTHKGHTSLGWTRWDSGTLIGLLKDLDYIEKQTVSDIMPGWHFDLMVSATSR